MDSISLYGLAYLNSVLSAHRFILELVTERDKLGFPLSQSICHPTFFILNLLPAHFLFLIIFPFFPLFTACTTFVKWNLPTYHPDDVLVADNTISLTSAWQCLNSWQTREVWNRDILSINKWAFYVFLLQLLDEKFPMYPCLLSIYKRMQFTCT